MKIKNISAFHTVTELPQGGTDCRIVSPGAEGTIKTVQSIILKAPKTADSEFVIKSVVSGGTRHEIMNVLVAMNSTKIINVKQQLPATISMHASASAGGVITVNGVEATLGE